jgi:hypothetical protein
MRRVSVALILCACFEVLLPAPANAWWEWVDRLSGPGRFNGPQFEVRLVCFGDSHQEQWDRAWDLVQSAQAQTAAAQAATGDDKALNDAWSQAEKAWRDAALSWRKIAVALSAQSVPADKLGDTIAAPLNDATWGALKKKAESSQQVTDALTKSANSTKTAMNTMGVLWATCPDDKIRRASIDLGVGVWRAKPEAQYANDKEITLTTLLPSFSWRVFPNPKYDFLDAAIGAGVYWFSSPGFSSFSGVILEPGRLDFHAPSSWSGEPFCSPKRWAALPTFRVGLLIFPGGFEKDAFAATGEKAVRLPAELTRSYSLFLNLEPLVRHWTKPKP